MCITMIRGSTIRGYMIRGYSTCKILISLIYLSTCKYKHRSSSDSAEREHLMLLVGIHFSEHCK
jgi:hypothetical protein